jgi:hypothetical protein
VEYQRKPRDRVSIAVRLRMIRLELYGEDGCPDLAGRLGLHVRTWVNYEDGVTIPGEVLLAFLELTGTNPGWILRGVGEKYGARFGTSKRLGRTREWDPYTDL